MPEKSALSILKPIPMRQLLKLSANIDRTIDRIGRLSSGLVPLTIAVGFYNVVARYIGRLIGLKLSSNALLELQWYLFSLTFFLGFAYILKRSANVRVDFLYANWDQKRRAWVDFLGTVFCLIPFCILGIWVSFNPVLQSWGRLPDGTWAGWELSADADGLPRAPIKTMLIVAFLLLLVQAISQAIKNLAVLRGYTQALHEDSPPVPLE
jgi:TRAP-type mannitol/chloroaromatic compound transport system permease small subunit